MDTGAKSIQDVLPGLHDDLARYETRSNSFSGFLPKRKAASEQSPPVLADAHAAGIHPGNLSSHYKSGSYTALALMGVEQNPIKAEEWQGNFRRGSLTHSLQIAQAGWGIGKFGKEQSLSPPKFSMGGMLLERAEEEERSHIAEIPPKKDDAKQLLQCITVGDPGFHKYSVDSHDIFASSSSEKVKQHYKHSQQYHSERPKATWKLWLGNVHLEHNNTILRESKAKTNPGAGTLALPSGGVSFQKQDLQVGRLPSQAPAQVPAALVTQPTAAQDVRQLPLADASPPSLPKNASNTKAPNSPRKSFLTEPKKVSHRELNMTMPSGW